MLCFHNHNTIIYWNPFCLSLVSTRALWYQLSTKFVLFHRCRPQKSVDGDWSSQLCGSGFCTLCVLLQVRVKNSCGKCSASDRCCLLMLLLFVMFEGWCSGESACLPPMWLRFDSGLVSYCGLVEFVVGSHLQGFFLGTLIFLPPRKTNISRFQFDQEGGPAWKLANDDVSSSLKIN